MTMDLHAHRRAIDAAGDTGRVNLEVLVHGLSARSAHRKAKRIALATGGVVRPVDEYYNVTSAIDAGDIYATVFVEE